MSRVESSRRGRERRRESRVERRGVRGVGARREHPARRRRGVGDERAKVGVEVGEGADDAGEVAGFERVDVVKRESREGGGSGVGVHLSAERDGVEAAIFGVADASSTVHASAVRGDADARAVERAERGGDVDGVERRAVAVDDAEDVLGGARLDREHAVDERRGEGVGGEGVGGEGVGRRARMMRRGRRRDAAKRERALALALVALKTTEKGVVTNGMGATGGVLARRDPRRERRDRRYPRASAERERRRTRQARDQAPPRATHRDQGEGERRRRGSRRAPRVAPPPARSSRSRRPRPSV